MLLDGLNNVEVSKGVHGCLDTSHHLDKGRFFTTISGFYDTSFELKLFQFVIGVDKLKRIMICFSLSGYSGTNNPGSEASPFLFFMEVNT